MRIIALMALIGAVAPQMAAADEAQIVAQPVANFRTLTPSVTPTKSGVFVEGGYCRQTRYAARPQTVRIVKIDAAGAETASETVRVLGATGNRSQGCGYYAARANWALSNGEKIEIQPSVR